MIDRDGPLPGPTLRARRAGTAASVAGLSRRQLLRRALGAASTLWMVGVGAILVATIGLWLRLGDGAGPWARIALDLAIAGHLVWFAALGAALVGADYGLSRR